MDTEKKKRLEKFNRKRKEFRITNITQYPNPQIEIPKT